MRGDGEQNPVKMKSKLNKRRRRQIWVAEHQICLCMLLMRTKGRKESVGDRIGGRREWEWGGVRGGGSRWWWSGSVRENRKGEGGESECERKQK